MKEIYWLLLLRWQLVSLPLNRVTTPQGEPPDNHHVSNKVQWHITRKQEETISALRTLCLGCERARGDMKEHIKALVQILLCLHYYFPPSHDDHQHPPPTTKLWGYLTV